MVATSPSQFRVRSESPYMRHMKEKLDSYQSSYMKRMSESPSLSIQQSASLSKKLDVSDSRPPSEFERKNIFPSHNMLPPQATQYHSFPALQSPRVPDSPSDSIDAILCESRNEKSTTSKTNARKNHFSFDSSSPLRAHLPPSSVGNKTSNLNVPIHHPSSFIKEESSKNEISKKEAIQSKVERLVSEAEFHSKSKRNQSTSEYIPPNPENANNSNYVMNRSDRRLNQPNDSQFWTQVSVKVSYALLKRGAPKKYAEVAQMTVVQEGAKRPDTSQESLNYVASLASLAIMNAGGNADIAAVATVQCLQGTEEIHTSEEQFQDVAKMMSQMYVSTQGFVSSRVDEGQKVVQVLSSQLSDKLFEFRRYARRTIRLFQENLHNQKSYNNRMSRSRLDRGSTPSGRSSRRSIKHSNSRSPSCSSRSSGSYSSTSSYTDRGERNHHSGSGSRSYKSSYDSSYKR